MENNTAEDRKWETENEKHFSIISSFPHFFKILFDKKKKRKNILSWIHKRNGSNSIPTDFVIVRYFKNSTNDIIIIIENDMVTMKTNETKRKMRRELKKNVKL